MGKANPTVLRSNRCLNEVETVSVRKPAAERKNQTGRSVGMVKKSSRETRQVKCPEEDRMASLLLEWHDEKGKQVLNSVVCDNPRLRDLDNWECEWSCWEKVAAEQK